MWRILTQSAFGRRQLSWCSGTVTTPICREKGEDQMSGAKSASLLRDHSSAVRVSNIELFFDPIYIFTIAQLSHRLLGNPTLRERGRRGRSRRRSGWPESTELGSPTTSIPSGSHCG
jgi:hypothetical protein